MRRVLITAGAPHIVVDAVRYMTVRATGSTAVNLAKILEEKDVGVDILTGPDGQPEQPWRRYRVRQELEAGIQQWLSEYPDGVVVMSAAINDYEVNSLERRDGETVTTYTPDAKLPSRADEVVIRLRPASKVIDQLTAWGHTGPLVGFKFEGAETVIASAQSQVQRTGANLVVANSICGATQALVTADEVCSFADRASLLSALASRIHDLSTMT